MYVHKCVCTHKCVCLCVYKHSHTCMHTQLCVYVLTSLCLHTHLCVYVNVYILTSLCFDTHLCVYVNVYVHINVYIYVYVNVYVHIHIYIYVYMHIYIHTCRERNERGCLVGIVEREVRGGKGLPQFRALKSQKRERGVPCCRAPRYLSLAVRMLLAKACDAEY